MQGDFSGGRRVMFWELVRSEFLYGALLKSDAGEDGTFLTIAGAWVTATVAYAYVWPWRYKRDPSMALVTPGISFGSSPLNLRPASRARKDRFRFP